jgi:hypothetical protein
VAVLAFLISSVAPVSGLPLESMARMRASKRRAMVASCGYAMLLGMAEPDWTDAKFKVIRDPRPQRRSWFDWRNFLLVAGLSLIPILRALIESP